MCTYQIAYLIILQKQKKTKKKSYKVNVHCLSVELRLKMQYFYTKDKSQRQIECAVQNGTITKNGVLPVIFLFFKKILSSIRITYKELIWCANYANVHIRPFCKRSSFLWGYFFPVSILNITSKYLSIFSNKSLACWVVHIARYFLSCYFCSRYSSMVGPMQIPLSRTNGSSSSQFQGPDSKWRNLD